MAQAASLATNELGRILRGEAGLSASVANLQMSTDTALALITGSEIISGQIGADIYEKSAPVKYPSFHIYCSKIVNKLQEKFRTFSGTAELTIEVRVSHDHIRELHERLYSYVQSVTDVLDKSRGTWSDGVFFTGGYEVSFQPVKRGGKNFLQIAKIDLELHVNTD